MNGCVASKERTFHRRGNDHCLATPSYCAPTVLSVPLSHNHGVEHIHDVVEVQTQSRPSEILYQLPGPRLRNSASLQSAIQRVGLVEDNLAMWTDKLLSVVP